MVYVCQLDGSIIPIIQFGTLIDQFGIVVYLREWAQHP
jgi:hypothetical protein